MAAAPRVSCCRRIEDEMLARAAKDMDLLLIGSAHGVPTEVGCRWWQSIAGREANPLLQWAHRYPNPCGTFLAAGLSPIACRIMQARDKFCSCVLPCLWIYCGNGAPATISTTITSKEQAGIRRIARDVSFAHLFMLHGRSRLLSLQWLCIKKHDSMRTFNKIKFSKRPFPRKRKRL
jgi:hypothetical protein